MILRILFGRRPEDSLEVPPEALAIVDQFSPHFPDAFHSITETAGYSTLKVLELDIPDSSIETLFSGTLIATEISTPDTRLVFLYNQIGGGL